MVHLNTYTYALPCTKRGESYFPEGSRHGLLISARRGDEELGVGEYAPMLRFHSHTVADVMAMIQRCNKAGFFDVFSLGQDIGIGSLAKIFAVYPSPLSYVLSMIHVHGALKNAACT